MNFSWKTINFPSHTFSNLLFSSSCLVKWRLFFLNNFELSNLPPKKLQRLLIYLRAINFQSWLFLELFSFPFSDETMITWTAACLTSNQRDFLHFSFHFSFSIHSRVSTLLFSDDFFLHGATLDFACCILLLLFEFIDSINHLINWLRNDNAIIKSFIDELIIM